MCDVNSTKSTEKRVEEKIFRDQKNTVVAFTIKTSDDTNFINSHHIPSKYALFKGLSADGKGFTQSFTEKSAIALESCIIWKK